MNHTDTYPCAWCPSMKKDLDTIGDMRTILKCNQNFKEYKKFLVKKGASKFENCVNVTIIKTNGELILNLLPPPELHLLLDCVNHMFD